VLEPKIDVNKINYMLKKINELYEKLPEDKKLTRIEWIALGMTIVYGGIEEIVRHCEADRGDVLMCKDVLYDMLITLLVDIVFRIFGDLDWRIMKVIDMTLKGQEKSRYVI